MTVFAITLAWNNEKELSKLYPTLKRALSIIPDHAFWLVRDNDSKDKTQDLIKSWNDPDFVIPFKVDNNKSNFSAGNNFLVKQADEMIGIDWDNDYFLLCNSDITIEDEFSIRHMLNLFKEDNVGIVGSKLLYPKLPGNPTRLQHAGVIFSPKYNYNPFHYRWREPDDANSSKSREFQAITGAFTLIKASCWCNSKAKGLNENYHWAFEDIDLCLDVKLSQNKRVLYCGKTSVTHHESLCLDINKVNKKFMKHNIGMFKRAWDGRIEVDHYNYLNDPLYKVINEKTS